jgi:hypothetical protein
MEGRKAALAWAGSSCSAHSVVSPALRLLYPATAKQATIAPLPSCPRRTASPTRWPGGAAHLRAAEIVGEQVRYDRAIVQHQHLWSARSACASSAPARRPRRPHLPPFDVGGRFDARAATGFYLSVITASARLSRLRPAAGDGWELV